MQVLTGQYPQMYTHKYRLRYTDYSAAGVKYKAVKLFDVARGYQVLWCMMQCPVLFAGPGLSTVTFRIHQSNTLPATDSANGAYMSLAHNSQLPYVGNFQTIQPRTASVGGVSRTIIGDVSAAYSIYSTIQLSGTPNLNQLTNGTIDIWVCIIKVP